MIDPSTIVESIGYELESKIWQGGLSKVYLGRRKDHGQPLAFKTVEDLNQEVPLFLLREYEILRDLDHPNIIRALDLVKHQGRFLLVMEYFDGVSLNHSSVMSGSAVYSPKNLGSMLLILKKLLSALKYIHDQNVVHCLLTPGHVLVGKDLDLRLINFGHARPLDEDDSALWSEESLAGVPIYMAPEQYLGEFLTPAVDFYAFGILLCTILCDRHPFHGFTFTEMLKRKVDRGIDVDELLQNGASTRSAEFLSELLRRDAAHRLSNHEEVIFRLDELFADSK